MVSLKTGITLGIIAIISLIAIRFRGEIGETFGTFASGISSLGGGIGSGITSAIVTPAAGIGAVAKGVVESFGSFGLGPAAAGRQAPQFPTFPQVGTKGFDEFIFGPFSDIIRAGRPSDAVSPPAASSVIPTIEDTPVSPGNREFSDFSNRIITLAGKPRVIATRQAGVRTGEQIILKPRSFGRLFERGFVS